MKRGKDEPGLWEPEGAPEIDRALEDEDDPLGRVVLRTSPPIFPEGETARTEEAAPLFADAEPEVAPPSPTERSAPPGARLRAFAADAVVCAVVAAASLLSAAAVVRRSPSPAAWLWCAAFALVVSFFVVVPTLALFGRTPGMALADLSAGGEDEKPSFGASLRRWLGTAATVLLAGLPLLSALFDRERRTPADIWSGRALHADREPVA